MVGRSNVSSLAFPKIRIMPSPFCTRSLIGKINSLMPSR